MIPDIHITHFEMNPAREETFYGTSYFQNSFHLSLKVYFWLILLISYLLTLASTPVSLVVYLKCGVFIWFFVDKFLLTHRNRFSSSPYINLGKCNTLFRKPKTSIIFPNDLADSGSLFYPHFLCYWWLFHYWPLTSGVFWGVEVITQALREG
jgi:hypothetical protein